MFLSSYKLKTNKTPVSSKMKIFYFLFLVQSFRNNGQFDCRFCSSIKLKYYFPGSLLIFSQSCTVLDDKLKFELLPTNILRKGFITLTPGNFPIQARLNSYPLIASQMYLFPDKV